MSVDFLTAVAEYEKDLPSEAELVAEHDVMIERLLAAKAGDDPAEARDAKHALRHARWYWRTIREVYPAPVAPGDAVAGTGFVRNGG